MDNTSNFPLSGNQSQLYNGSLLHPELSLGLKIGMTMAYALTFVLGFFGNGIGMLIVYKRTCMTSVTNLFIANMAFADFMVTILAIPTSIADLYISNRWIAGPFGVLTCKLTHFSLYVSLAASVITIVFISVERYITIFFPLRGDIVRSPKAITALIWTISCCFASPVFIIFTTEKDGEYYLCKSLWPWGGLEATMTVLSNYFMTCFIVLYMLPLLFLGCIYTLISVKLCKRTSPETTPGHIRSSVRHSRKKVVKLLIGIVVVFAVCWLPAHVMHYIIVYETQLYPQIQHVAFVSFWLCQANSSINPCLYVYLNDSFRKDFVKIVLCIFRKVKKGFCFCSISFKCRPKLRQRNRYEASSEAHSHRKLSFIQLLQVVRGTFNSPTGRLTGETRISRNSLTGVNNVKVVDTRF